MAVPRKDLFDPTVPTWLHCTNRCVRQAFLCGFDHVDDRNLNHRKAWIEHRLRRAAAVFCVEVAAYAVMSNHIHLVVRMRPDLSAKLSDEDVVDRWLHVFPGYREDSTSTLTERLPEPRSNRRMEILADPSDIAKKRDQLSNIGTFMKVIVEPVARWANDEDEVSGRFWEGRFKTHPVLDLKALIATMVYVDLNPIRAGISDRIEHSACTSGQERLKVAMRSPSSSSLVSQTWLEPIKELTAWDAASGWGGWDEKLYLKLLDRSARLMRPGKRGRTDPDLPRILERIGIESKRWSDEMSRSGTMTGTIGHPDKQREEARRRGCKLVRSSCRLFTN